MVLVLGLDPDQVEAESQRWRTLGAMVMRARTVGGCLRMATCLGPNVIVLDRRSPERLVRLLRAHPVSSSARIEWLPSVQPSNSRRAAIG
jgi:ribosomal protein L34